MGSHRGLVDLEWSHSRNVKWGSTPFKFESRPGPLGTCTLGQLARMIRENYSQTFLPSHDDAEETRFWLAKAVLRFSKRSTFLPPWHKSNKGSRRRFSRKALATCPQWHGLFSLFISIHVPHELIFYFRYFNSICNQEFFADSNSNDLTWKVFWCRLECSQ